MLAVGRVPGIGMSYLRRKVLNCGSFGGVMFEINENCTSKNIRGTEFSRKRVTKIDDSREMRRRDLIWRGRFSGGSRHLQSQTLMSPSQTN